MAKFNERLKLLRTETGLSQQNFANQLGISKSSINMYERGEREPSLETLEAIADYFNVDIDYLMGKSEHRSKSAWLEGIGKPAPFGDDATIYDLYDNLAPVELKRFPLLGEIACGEPIYADEDRESYIMADADIKADFCLIAKGDSMINARIYDGDIVFIRKQPIVRNGEIAAIIIGDEATLKRVYYYQKSNKLILQAENPAYEPLIYTDEELDTVRILGKAVYFMSAL